MKDMKHETENLVNICTDDGLGVLLLVITFNSIIFVGPILRLLYDSIILCCERNRGSGKEVKSKKWLSNCCAHGMDTDCVDSNHENGSAKNNSDILEDEDTVTHKLHAVVGDGIKDNSSLPIHSRNNGWIKRDEMNDSEFVDEENYIMKTPSSSFASSNRLDDSLSTSSQDNETMPTIYERW